MQRSDFMEAKQSHQYDQHPVKFRNEIRSYPIVYVPIDEMYYRANNHRIQVAIKEHIEKSNGVYSEQTLKGDITRKDVQNIIEDILGHALGSSSVLLQEKLKKEHQTIPLYLTVGDVVVNGNSRLFLMRQLVKENPVKYAHFKHVRCVYLPSDATESEIDEFEIQEQIEEEVKVEYQWYEKAHWMDEKRKEHRLTDEKTAQLFKLEKNKAKRLLDAFQEASLYLEKIGKPFHFKMIKDDRSAFEALAQEKRKFSHDPVAQTLIEQITYEYIGRTKEETPERLLVYIPKIGTHLEAIKKGVIEQGPLSTAFESINEDDEEDELLEINENTKETNKILSCFSTLTEAERKETTDIIDQIIDFETIKSKEKQKKQYPYLKLKQSLEHLQESFLHYKHDVSHDTKTLQLLTDIHKWCHDYQKKVKE